MEVLPPLSGGSTRGLSATGAWGLGPPPVMARVYARLSVLARFISAGKRSYRFYVLAADLASLDLRLAALGRYALGILVAQLERNRCR